MDKNVRELAEKIKNLHPGLYLGLDVAEQFAQLAIDFLKPSPSEQSQKIEKGIDKFLDNIYCVDCLSSCVPDKEDPCEEFKEYKAELLLLFNSQQKKVAGEKK